MTAKLVLGSTCGLGLACMGERAWAYYESRRMRHVVVVGGGVMGRATALSLMESNLNGKQLRVTVIDEVCVRARTIRRPHARSPNGVFVSRIEPRCPTSVACWVRKEIRAS